MAKTGQKGKTNNNTLLYALVAALVILAVAVTAGVVINNMNNGNNSSESSQTGDGLATELANVDVTVQYGDFEAMEALSKDIQNGEATGKVVKIDGVVMHPGTLYSIGQEKATGGMKIGTQFIIEDADAADYPADGDRVTITGKVIEKEPLYYIIKTTKAFVEAE